MVWFFFCLAILTLHSHLGMIQCTLHHDPTNEVQLKEKNNKHVFKWHCLEKTPTFSMVLYFDGESQLKLEFCFNTAIECNSFGWAFNVQCRDWKRNVVVIVREKRKILALVQ